MSLTKRTPSLASMCRTCRLAIARCVVFGLSLAATVPASAKGVSPYLPLHMAPEVERDIERVLILADRTVMTRPIPAATVLEALPIICRDGRERALCRRVRGHLNRYMADLGLDHASVEAAGVDGAAVSLPNRRGMLSDSSWQVAALAHWQPFDHMLVSLGGVAYDDDAVASGSMVGLGWEYAQLDVGYRAHWFSPFENSAMLISTQAKTLPSITLSNYTPISRFGFSYEVFVAEMPFSDNIAFEGGITAGHPKLAGLLFAIEPATGWSLSFIRRPTLRSTIRISATRSRGGRAALCFRAEHPSRCIWNTPERIVPMTGTIGSVMQRCRSASRFRGCGNTSISPMKCPSGRTAGMSARSTGTD
jgi:hypothetical protein